MSQAARHSSLSAMWLLATTVAQSRSKVLISEDFGVHKSLSHNDLRW